MTLQVSIENLEKSFLDSMYVISHSSQTCRSYKTGINRFRSFLKEKYQINEFDLLDKIKNNELEIYPLLKEFVVSLDKLGMKPQTIKLSMTVIKGYLRHMGLKIDSDDLKQLVKLPRIVKIREIPLTKEIIIRLLRNAKPKLQLAILIASSSGMRLGEMTQLRISDIDFKSNPTKVYLRADTTKTRQFRETFLSTEATNALKDYIKRFHKWNENTNDSKVLERGIFGPVLRFGEKFCPESAAQMLQVHIKDLVRSIPDLDTKDENGRASIHFHAFRKFFRTTVGNAVGRDFAEALMGHGFYMDTYYQLPEEKKSEKPVVLNFSNFKIEDPILPRKLAEEADFMAKKIYPVIYVFENSVRNFIIKSLEKKYGPDWWDKVTISSKTKQKVEGRISDEDRNRWHGKRGAHPIFYSDIDDLKNIITSNWNDFKSHLKTSQAIIIANIEIIEQSRNVISHNNPLSNDDIDSVKVHFKHWIKLIKNVKF